MPVSPRVSRLGRLLALSAGLALLLGVSVGGRAQAANLEIHSTFPRGVAFIADSEKNLVDLIAEHSGGTVRARLYNSGEVIPGNTVFDAVRTGKVQAGFGWIGYWAAAVPVAELLGAMPFGPSPATAVSWMYGGEGLELLQAAFAPQGVHILPCHIVAAEAGGWFRREIRTVGDLKGLRMRISGLGGEVIAQLGAIPSAQPLEQMYPALAEGRLDAAEFSVPVADMSIGFETFAKHYYFPGWHQPSSWNALIINAKTWAGLDPRGKAGIAAACRLNTLWTLTAQTGSQVAAIEQIRTLGVSVNRLPDAVLEALLTASRVVLEEKARRDPIYGKTYRSLTTFMNRELSWETLQALPRPPQR